MNTMKLAPWQLAALYNPYQHFAMFAGVACVRGSTLVETENGKIPIRDLKVGTRVLSVKDDRIFYTPCETPVKKGSARLFRVVTSSGEFVAHGLHLIALPDGSYRRVAELLCHDEVLGYFSSPPVRSSVASQITWTPSESHSNQISLNSQCGCLKCSRLRGQPLPWDLDIDRAYIQSKAYAQQSIRSCVSLDDHGTGGSGIHCDQSENLHENKGSYARWVDQEDAWAYRIEEQLLAHTSQPNQAPVRFQKLNECHRLRIESLLQSQDLSGVACAWVLRNSVVLSIELLDEFEDFYDIEIPETGVYFAEGVIHHNSGKSFTGSQFAIRHMMKYPDLTGCVGANTWDQLNQATMRELFHWLEHYGLQYVIHQRPPASWGAKLQFPIYKNILSVKIRDKVATVFIRVMSDENPLRGIQFSWYWLDETRDTPHATHDVVLSRLRESRYIKGLITSTTNGEDWAYERFVKNARRGQLLYGSLHARTSDSLRHGIISQQYYDGMVSSYSPLMAAQELEAQHVNVASGRAYYSASELNRRHVAPWGDSKPNRDRPLIVGCDFNFDPAPHVWMVGQIGPSGIVDPKDGIYFDEKIHWFGEIARNRASTPLMAQVLVQQYPDFVYRIFGDRSGARATTSNAGKFDYDQIREVIHQNGQTALIDSDQSNNPLVRNRVENMNRLFCNAMNEVRQTYNPSTCPHFDADVKMVGWKQTVRTGQGKLDHGGNLKLTHATDGGGYAMWKLFPPRKRAAIVKGVPNMSSQLVGGYQGWN